MPQKIQDITPNAEKPQNIPQPEAHIQPEMPGQVEIETKTGVEAMPSLPSEGQVAEEKIGEFTPAPAPITVTPPLAVKSPTLEKIENILQEDLQDIYFQMPPKKQAEFREVGEETATRIDKMMRGVKVQVKKVLELIISWLKIIPGLNRYFLEQEAKIKADEILKLKQGQKQSTSGWDKNKI
ncbi:MAG: hypothetical protein NTX82_01060 [Candidatus Parcubacteria bacterium]|nr:hypothetical protein [Candidatus Parcubacteria bacterium]